MRTPPFTVVSWNIDGAARTLEPAVAAARGKSPANRIPLPELHAQLGAPDVFALQEVRIRASDAPLIGKLERALPGYSCGHSLCRDAVNVRFRGGRAYGVTTFVRAELGPKWLERPAWDREGRLVAFELSERKLMVANVYAVNGTDKAYFDPESGAPNGDRHTYKRQFQTHLLDYFRAACDRGLSLVLVGDWNISRAAIDTHPRLRTEPPHAAARALLNDVFIPALELEDIFRARNPERRAYTWFNRVAARYGRLDAARVDYALISKSLSPAVAGADILQDRALVLGSDHAPVTLAIAGSHMPPKAKTKTKSKPARRPSRVAKKKSAAPKRKAASSKTGRSPATKRKPAKAAKPPRLLSGGNPQIAKGYGEAPVKAYIAALPGWKRALGRRLDALITRTIPGVNKAVKWNSPMYGVEGQGWFLGVHAFTNYLKLAFFRGSALRPLPPGESKDENTRYLDIREDDELDEKQLAEWLRQAASRPGWMT